MDHSCNVKRACGLGIPSVFPDRYVNCLEPFNHWPSDAVANQDNDGIGSEFEEDDLNGCYGQLNLFVFIIPFSLH